MVRKAVTLKAHAEPMSERRPVVLQLSFSHYCHKATWGLSHAGIPYDVLNTLPHHMAKWPSVASGTVPVMRVGDEIIDGSHQILQWAEARNQNEPLYPKRHRKVVEDWETWADETVGAVARRQAYRVLYDHPSRFDGPLSYRLAARFARPMILGIMKYYKSRRFDGTDPEESRQIIKRIVGGIGASGFLVGSHRTAADIAVAALVEPLVQAWPGLDLGLDDEVAAVRDLIGRARPPLLQERRRRARRRDFLAWRALAGAGE